MPFHRALKPKKSKAVKGKPHTIATTPATNECHLIQPNAKSTTAQIEKKTSAVGRFIFTKTILYCSMLNRPSENRSYHQLIAKNPINASTGNQRSMSGYATTQELGAYISLTVRSRHPRCSQIPSTP